MTNGSMNVEIGNPAYKIYEGDPDDDAGELLDSDFALDPDKVKQLKTPLYAKCIHKVTYIHIHIFMIYTRIHDTEEET